MSDKVYLETDEEITSAIDKIASATSSTVYVLVPRRASIIQSIVNLKLLRRQADLLQKKVVLVTTDVGGRGLAKKAGLATQAKLSSRSAPDEVEEEKALETTGTTADTAGPEEVDLTDRELDDDHPADKQDTTHEPAGDPLSQEIKLNGFFGLSKKSQKSTQPTSRPGVKKKLPALTRILTTNKKEAKRPATGGSISTGKEEEPKSQRTSFRKTKKGRLGKVFLLPSLSIKSFSLFSIISLVILGIVFFLVLPKAEVLLVPKTEPFSTSFEVVISQNIENVDTEKSTIPGESITADGKSSKKKFTATGEKEMGDKARGQVILYNNFSSESLTFPASTQLVTNGLVFLTLQDVVVPGARVEGGDTISGQVKVRVEAGTPGEDYNIGASRFVIASLSKSKQGDIYGQSSAQFTGGSSRKVKIASDKDLSEARNSLLTEAVDEAIKKLEEGQGNNKMLAKELLAKEIVEVESSIEAEAEVDDFEMQVKAKVTGFAFQENDLAKLLASKFEQLVPVEKYIIDESVKEGVTFEKVEHDFGEEEALTAKVIANKEVAWRFNEQKIKREIKGKNEQEAEEYILGNPNIISAEVFFWPFWVKKVPKSEGKIDITLDKDGIADRM